MSAYAAADEIFGIPSLKTMFRHCYQFRIFDESFNADGKYFAAHIAGASQLTVVDVGASES